MKNFKVGEFEEIQVGCSHEVSEALATYQPLVKSWIICGHATNLCYIK